MKKIKNQWGRPWFPLRTRINDRVIIYGDLEIDYSEFRKTPEEKLKLKILKAQSK